MILKRSCQLVFLISTMLPSNRSLSCGGNLVTSFAVPITKILGLFAYLSSNNHSAEPQLASSPIIFVLRSAKILISSRIITHGSFILSAASKKRDKFAISELRNSLPKIGIKRKKHLRLSL